MLHPVNYVRRVAFVLFLLGLALVFAPHVHALAVGGDGQLLVENQSLSDARVYAMRQGGGLTRLGLVPGYGKATLRLPAGLLSVPGDLYFVTRPMASDVSDTSNYVEATPEGSYLLFITAQHGLNPAYLRYYPRASIERTVLHLAGLDAFRP